MDKSGTTVSRHKYLDLAGMCVCYKSKWKKSLVTIFHLLSLSAGGVAIKK